MRFVFLLPAALACAAAAEPAITFQRDVLPILQKNCQGCHRAGEPAPMPFMTYQQVRPWAKAIRESVRLRRMPPWFADPHIGRFSNDRSLSQADIETISAWVDAGAPEGDARDAPPPRKFIEGWNIGKPDLVLEMPAEYEVPTSGTIEYTYYVIPTGFTEDKWVQFAEVRPGNRKVVHHVIAFAREPGSKWLRDARPGQPFVPADRETARAERGSMGQWLVGYAPGTVPDMLEPGRARLVKAGSDIVLQMHYTTVGKAQKDRTRVGFIFAKEPPAERVYTLAAANFDFVIPPRADSHRVEAKITLDGDAKLIGLFPHMHLRGKSFAYRVIYPTGETQDLLSVPHYSFNWQLSYFPEKPLALSKGTTIECVAYFDNSPNNPANPNPNTEVRFGDQSWEEMMFGFFDVALDPAVDPAKLVVMPKRKPARADD